MPITKEEAHRYLSKNGWPSDAVLRNRATQHPPVAPDPNEINVDDHFDVWGIGRKARNVNPIALDAAKFRICDKGLFNMLEHRLGKSKADSGNAMLMISGPSAQEAGRLVRVLCIVSGVCYSPKVWGATMCIFEDATTAHNLELNFPCWARLATRASRLSRHFMTLDMKTSDEFVRDLISSMTEMKAALVDYNMDLRDGTLLWSRVVGIQAHRVSGSPCISAHGLDPSALDIEARLDYSKRHTNWCCLTSLVNHSEHARPGRRLSPIRCPSLRSTTMSHAFSDQHRQASGAPIYIDNRASGHMPFTSGARAPCRTSALCGAKA